MQLQTNSIHANSVRRVTEGGREFLVAGGVTMGKPAFLDGGWVPADAWRESVDAWADQPLPIGHPTSASGEFVSAHNAAVDRNAVVGHIRNPTYNESVDGVDGDLWVDVEKAHAVGDYGERVVEILENGDPLDVSTAYRADEADPADYPDVEHDRIRHNLDPDHLALLPDELGPGRLTPQESVGIQASSGVMSADTGPTASAAMATNTAGFCVNAQDGDDPDRVAVSTNDPDENADADNSSEEGESGAETPAVGEQVRWPAGPETTRYGIVTDDTGLADDGGLAVTIWTQADGGWSRTNQTATVAPDATTTLGQFPPTAKNAAGERVAANVLDSPRTPEYEGTTTGEWDAPSLGEYIDAFATEADQDESRVEDLSEESKRAVASKTFLGDPEADTADDLRSFPAVTTGNDLHESALDAVVSRAPQAEYLSESEADALQSKARSLLEEEFDREIEANTDGGDAAAIAAGAGADPDARSMLTRMRDLLNNALGSGTGGTESGGDTADGPASATPDNEADTNTDGAASAEAGSLADAIEFSDTQTILDIPMTEFTDDEIEELAANSQYDAAEIRDDPETAAEALKARAFSANADDEQDDEDNDDEDADADEDGTAKDIESKVAVDDLDADDLGDQLIAAVEAKMDAKFDAQLDPLREDVNELKANREEERESEREHLASEIKANSEELPDAAVEAMDLDTLRETHESVMANARTSSGTDFSALDTPSAGMSANADDDDVDMASAGSFSDFLDDE